MVQTALGIRTLNDTRNLKTLRNYRKKYNGNFGRLGIQENGLGKGLWQNYCFVCCEADIEIGGGI